MKTAVKTLLILAPFLVAKLAVAQIQQNAFKHIIIVVQENRTPDNLFGSAPSGATCGSEDPFMPGVDIDNGGPNNTAGVPSPTCNMSLQLNGWDSELVNGNPVGMIDPDHTYIPGWTTDFDYYGGAGHMDGFCHEFGNPNWPHPCPSYSYVQASGVQPYFFIAQNYSFANYMFQTSEGPSFPAHQFLFTGTSAPVAPNDTGYLDFVAEGNKSQQSFGCAVPGDGEEWALPDGTETTGTGAWECYAHDSLVTASVDCENGYCDRGISWGYYEPKGWAIWDAPMANPQTCYGEASGGGHACGGSGHTEYTDHVHIATKNGYSDAPIFDDLYGCNLPAISWVIPDQKWSDHPYDPGKGNSTSWSLGPYWVGDIINGVGTACGGKYWSGTEPTAIFVVWDDWGGWFDHVKPWAYYRGTSSACTGYAPNGWGCGYVSGFRVPLMVVSAWTGTQTQSGVTGYVSGACSGLSCPNMQPQFTHDFGSILAFTEYNFGMPFIDGSPDDGYADYNAPDWSSDHKTTPPLADFFQLSQPRTFVPVPIGQWTYNCFTDWGSCSGTSGPYVPEDPDDY